MRPLRPRDVIVSRIVTAEVLAQPKNQEQVTDWLMEDPGGVDRRRAETVTAATADSLHRAVLYLVVGDMLDLVGHAADTLPEHTFHQTDPPTDNGLCFLATPVTAPIRRGAAGSDHSDLVAFSWFKFEDQDDTGVMVMWWSQEADGPALLPALNYAAYEGEHWIKAQHGSAEGQPELAAWNATFWRMVQEPYVDVEQRVPKAARRAARGDVPPDPVRVVTLRRREPAEAADAGGAVDWSHRWWVNGYWRQQWYPSQGRHSPRYVLGHVKGPADKPFVPKETVRVLRR